MLENKPSYGDYGPVTSLSENGAGSWSRRSFIIGLGSLAFGGGVSRALASAGGRLPKSVLIIGDSMALCGFGEQLDARFREAGVQGVYTYMACGTQPLSWTTLKGYAGAKTRCGYWKIESQPDGKSPSSFQDTYGMTRGHKPAPYDVPKVEDLLPSTRPDLLVVQLGNNLFDLLKGKKTSWEGAELKPYIAPFLEKVAKASTSVKRIYWVAPPTCGRIAKEAQDVLVARLQDSSGTSMRVIDSRTLISYPYRGLQPDKQHFFGPDMKEWADQVFAWIQDDVKRSPLGALPLPPEDAVATAAPVVPEEPQPTLWAECQLESMAVPFTSKEIVPYNESLVAFVYRVRRVLKGSFKGSQVVVLRTAHIGGTRQPMHEYFLNQTRTLRLIPLDQTPWATLKAKDDVRFVDLDRFITEEDHQKLRNQS
jgi:hypothetical protein